MGARYDYADWIAGFRESPNVVSNLQVPITWAVLDMFRGNLDGGMVNRCRDAGVDLWSEDNATEQRVYHLSGSGRQLAEVMELLQKDLNTPWETSFTFSGFNGAAASLHMVMNQICQQLELPPPRITPYGGRFRSTLVIELSGPLGCARDALRLVETDIMPQVGEPTPRISRPPLPPVKQRQAPDLGLSA